MEVYKSVNLNVLFDDFARKKRKKKERKAHKFYGGQKDGQHERDNDTPKFPILWYAVREIIGRFDGGWQG